MVSPKTIALYTAGALSVLSVMGCDQKLEQENSELRTRVSTAERAQQALNTEIEQRRREAQDLKVQLDKVSDEVRTLRNDKAFLQGESAQRRQTIADLTATLQKAVESSGARGEQLAKIQEALEAIRNRPAPPTTETQVPGTQPQPTPGGQPNPGASSVPTDQANPCVTPANTEACGPRPTPPSDAAEKKERSQQIGLLIAAACVAGGVSAPVCMAAATFAASFFGLDGEELRETVDAQRKNLDPTSPSTGNPRAMPVVSSNDREKAGDLLKDLLADPTTKTIRDEFQKAIGQGALPSPDKIQFLLKAAGIDAIFDGDRFQSEAIKRKVIDQLKTKASFHFLLPFVQQIKYVGEG